MKKRKSLVSNIPAPLLQQAYYYTTIAPALDVVLPHPPCASPPCPPQR
jgi:hypothetical protein